MDFQLSLNLGNHAQPGAAWIRILLPLFFLIYLGVCFVWRWILVWKQTKKNPIVLGNSDNPHDYIGRIFGDLVIMATLAVMSYSTWDSLYQHLLPLPILESIGYKSLGFALLLISLGLCAVAQHQMGDSWRIGVDRGHKTALVRNGIFKYSRNPIYLSMMFTNLGLFLIIPNVLTWLILGLGFVLLQIQVRLEEEFLLELHGSEFTKYRKKVRRWL